MYIFKLNETIILLIAVCDFGVIYFGMSLLPQNVPSIQTATILCGGLSSLLFLFARVSIAANLNNLFN